MITGVWALWVRAVLERHRATSPDRDKLSSDSRALRCEEGHTKGAAIGNPTPAPSPVQ